MQILAIKAAAILMLVLLGCAPLSGQSEDSTAEVIKSFDRGNTAYASRDYGTALEAYREAESTGYSSFGLMYNLANTYFRLNNLGKAVLYYERARLIDPYNRALIHSRAIANQRTVDRLSMVPAPIWTRAVRAANRDIGTYLIFGIGYLFYILVVILLCFRIWRGAPNAWIRRGIAVFLIGALGFLIVAYWGSINSERISTGVIMVTQTDLLDAAQPDAEVTTRIHEGLVVEVIAVGQEWTEVKLSNGTTGWVRSSDLEAV